MPNNAAMTSSRARISTVPNATSRVKLSLVGNLWTQGSLAYQRSGLDIQEQMSTLFGTSQRVGRTIRKNDSELTLGKHHQGVAHCIDRAAETARWTDA